MSPALFQNIGFPEMMIILVVVLLLFGRRFPEVMRSIGKGFVELKKGLREVEHEMTQTEQLAKAPPAKSIERADEEEEQPLHADPGENASNDAGAG